SYTIQPIKVPVEFVTQGGTGGSFGGGNGVGFAPRDGYTLGPILDTPSRIHFDPYGFRGSDYPIGSSFESLRPHAPSLAALEGAETPVSELEQNYQSYRHFNPELEPYRIGFRK